MLYRIRSYSRKGAALLETLLAAILFAMAAVGIAALISGANRSSVKNSQRITAETLASRMVEAAIEDARKGTLPEPATGQFEVRSVRRGAESQTDYEFEVTVATLSGGIRDVGITVRWRYQESNLKIFREVLVYPTS